MSLPLETRHIEAIVALAEENGLTVVAPLNDVERLSREEIAPTSGHRRLSAKALAILKLTSPRTRNRL